MGEQVQCTVWFLNQVSPGIAQLETDVLRFHGQFGLAIPLKDVLSIDATDGQLVVNFPKGTARFDLGVHAEKWAQAIRTPKTLIDKLGIKPESQVSVLGVKDESFWQQLAQCSPVVSKGRLRQTSDFVIAAIEREAELVRLERLRSAIKDNGAIWVVWPKGSSQINENDVRKHAIAVGLVDVKVVRFSDTHSALKLIIPLALRAK